MLADIFVSDFLAVIPLYILFVDCNPQVGFFACIAPAIKEVILHTIEFVCTFKKVCHASLLPVTYGDAAPR